MEGIRIDNGFFEGECVIEPSDMSNKRRKGNERLETEFIVIGCSHFLLVSNKGKVIFQGSIYLPRSFISSTLSDN